MIPLSLKNRLLTGGKKENKKSWQKVIIVGWAGQSSFAQTIVIKVHKYDLRG